MNKSKPLILFLHTIIEQKKEWLKLLNLDEIILSIESENTNITNLFQIWHQNKVTLPDIVLIDMNAKTPDGHFFQVTALSRWCREKNLSVNIFALNGVDDQLSDFQYNWAKYQGITGIFPKLQPSNLLGIVRTLNDKLGENIIPLVKPQPLTKQPIEEKKIEIKETNTEPNFPDIPITKSEINTSEIVEQESIFLDFISTETKIPENDNETVFVDNFNETQEQQENLKDSFTETVLTVTPKTELESLNEAIQYNPSSAELFCQRGDVYLSSGNDQKALNDYQSAIKLDSKSEKGFLGRGKILIRQGNYQNAIKDLTQVLKFNSNNAFAYHERGLALFRLGNQRGARKDYDQAIKIKPDFSQAYNDRGFVQYFLGNTEEALQDYTLAIKYKPDYADAYYNRGNIYSDLGDFEKAIADYTEAISYNSKLAVAYGNRGIAYYELDRVSEAINDTTKSANLFYEQGDTQSYQQAIDTLKQMQ